MNLQNKEEQENIEITHFNSMVLVLRRINHNIELANRYAQVCNTEELNPTYLKQWSIILRNLRRDIWLKCTKEEKKRIIFHFKKLQEIPSIIEKVKTEEGYKSIINSSNFMRYYNKLDFIQLLLMDYATKHGMLTTNKEEDDDDLGNIGD